MFLHANWLHLGGNMLFLWVFGDNVEDILGHGKYLLFYLLCGAAAAMSQVLMDPSSRVPMVGASGAIAGVMGAYLMKFPHARVVMLTWFILIFTFDVPAWFMLVYWFLMQVFGGFGSVADATQQGGTALLRARRRVPRGDRADLPDGDAAALLATAGPELVSRPLVTLYTRAGCHLCDEAKKVIAHARSRAEFDYEERDIDAAPELLRLYNEEVPVIAIDGRKAFKYRLDMNEFLKRLAARAMNLDVLAIAAHPDDIEQTCGGTLIRMAEAGYRCGALDLTAGDMGTRGTPEQRVEESECAGRHMLLAWRGNLHFPDAR